MEIPLWAALALVAPALAIPAVVAVALIVAQRAAKRARFNQVVPGYGIRMRDCPWPMIEVADIVSDLITEWRKDFPEHSEAQLKRKLRGQSVLCIRAENRRFITDRWGRTVAGFHDVDHNVVAFLPDDYIGNTALVHELAHELDELNGKHRAHEDDRIFGEWGVVKRTNAAYRGAS